MKIIYLKPRSGYVTDLRSDTLWGALCWGIRYLWGEKELELLIENYKKGQPDFVISSVFPFKQQYGKEKIPFFPNPLVLAPAINREANDTIDDYRLRKKLKKIAWLNLTDFSNMLKGQLTVDDLLIRLRKEEIRKNEAEEKREEYVPLPETIDLAPPERFEYSMTHNTIDRLQGGTLQLPTSDGDTAGQLFHAEETYWVDAHNDSDSERPNTGIYFLVEGNIEKIVPVLRLFRDLGIGADRTSGKGSFDFEVEDFELPEPTAATSNALMNLSLWLPTEEELSELKGIQYQLERREGYVGGYRQRRIKQPRLYFAEGSVFERPSGYKGDHRMGCIQEQYFDAEHRLDHPVWDNGFGLMVNLNWKI